jgi:hypothetical protein
VIPGAFSLLVRDVWSFMRTAMLAVTLVIAAGAAAHAFEQIVLTEKQVLGFIAAQPDMEAIEKKVSEADTRNPRGPLLGEMDRMARKHGFAGFREFDAVAQNITMIMAGIDPATRTFSHATAEATFREEIEALRTDPGIPPQEKGAIIRELEEAVANVKRITNNANIELVKKHYDRIDAAVQ